MCSSLKLCERRGKGALMAETIANDASDIGPLIQALGLLRQALMDLDDGGVPADIGAYVDQAIVRLEDFLSESQK